MFRKYKTRIGFKKEIGDLKTMLNKIIYSYSRGGGEREMERVRDGERKRWREKEMERERDIKK